MGCIDYPPSLAEENGASMSEFLGTTWGYLLLVAVGVGLGVYMRPWLESRLRR